MKQVRQSLTERADESANREAGEWKVGFAKVLVNVGIGISAFLTIFYLMLLVEEVIDLPSPYSYMMGVLVGIVAIIPAEIALIVWRERLAGDVDITDWQKTAAVFGQVMAGLFSALTTSSFFSYFLPNLFPAAYMAIAPALNVGAIVGSWIVFIMTIVVYDINSRQTKQNLAQADANQKVLDARLDVLKGAAQAIKEGAEGVISNMEDSGLFVEDAMNLIGDALGKNRDQIDSSASLPEPVVQMAADGVQNEQPVYEIEYTEDGQVLSSTKLPDDYAPVTNNGTSPN